MLEHELKETLKAIESAEALQLMDDRQRHIFTALNIASMMEYESGIRPLKEPIDKVETLSKTPDWAGETVAYIVLPTGEISYFLNKHTKEFSGYTRPQKLARIHRYIKDDYQIIQEGDMNL